MPNLRYPANSIFVIMEYNSMFIALEIIIPLSRATHLFFYDVFVLLIAYQQRVFYKVVTNNDITSNSLHVYYYYYYYYYYDFNLFNYYYNFDSSG